MGQSNLLTYHLVTVRSFIDIHILPTIATKQHTLLKVAEIYIINHFVDGVAKLICARYLKLSISLIT